MYANTFTTFTTSSSSSAPVALTCSVTQRSVIGPQEFITYIEDIKETIDRFIVNHHLYADDSQLLAHMKINAVTEHRRRRDMRRKPPGLMFLTAVAAKPGQDRTDLVQLQSQLGEAQATRRHEC